MSITVCTTLETRSLKFTPTPSPEENLAYIVSYLIKSKVLDRSFRILEVMRLQAGINFAVEVCWLALFWQPRKIAVTESENWVISAKSSHYSNYRVSLIKNYVETSVRTERLFLTQSFYNYVLMQNYLPSFVVKRDKLRKQIFSKMSLLLQNNSLLTTHVPQLISYVFWYLPRASRCVGGCTDYAIVCN